MRLEWSTASLTGIAPTSHNVAVTLLSGAVLLYPYLYQPTTGLTCSKGTDCYGGYCVDGICCESSCLKTCNHCVAAVTPKTNSMQGKCVHLPYGKPDLSATSPCALPSFCDGKGFCFQVNGTACTKDSQCVSKFCVAGYCCDTLCSGACVSCKVKGTEGKCSPLPLNLACDPGKHKACNGSGKCLLNNGQQCSADSECVSDICKDGFCCNKACEKVCESCKLSGKEGKCSSIPAKSDLEGECIGKDPKCGGACDGNNQCVFPNKGSPCGASPCMACDGTGRCSKPPLDDTRCGVIDCDELDTPCKDFHDLRDLRCQALGICKPKNRPQTCDKYTELKCSDASVDLGERDVSAGADSGQRVDVNQAKPGDETSGCGCALDRASAEAGQSIYLLAMLGLSLLMRRRAW